MIQFQQAPAPSRSDSLVDLIEAKRIEELDQIQAEHRRQEEEQYSIEQQLKAESLKVYASQSFAQQATLVGINTVSFGIIAFLLRIAFLNAGYNPAAVVTTVIGSISLALSVVPVIGAFIGWGNLRRDNKRVRALKDRLKGGRQ